MQWSEIRKAYPNEWLVIEALQAHTTPTHQRLLDRIAVVERCADGNSAMQSYRCLHQQYPTREFYFIHTSRDELDIREQQWLGIRRVHATGVEGYAIRGVGGSEVVFSRRVDNLKLGECSIDDFEVQIGGMDYGFEINGILGMDFLLQAGAIINLRDMKIEFAR